MPPSYLLTHQQFNRTNQLTPTSSESELIPSSQTMKNCALLASAFAFGVLPQKAVVECHREMSLD